MKLHTIALLSIPLLCSPAEAAPLSPGMVLGIDFGDAEGAPPCWHNISTKQGNTRTQAGLTNTQGTRVDDVQIEWVFASDSVFNNDSAEDSFEMPGLPSLPDSALGDWMGINIQKEEQEITLRFWQLDTALTYSLTLGGANDIDNAHADTIWTIRGGPSKQTDASNGEKAFVTFKGLRPEADGSLVIHANSNQTINETGRPLQIAAIAALVLEVEGEPQHATTSAHSALITIGSTSLMVKEL